MNYYNEYDKKAAAWLRELIAVGLISKGDGDVETVDKIYELIKSHHGEEI